jgi:serine/threonine protein kinase
VIRLDLKPENILLSGTALAAAPCVRVGDFGICRPGPDAQGKGGEHLRADLVNTAVYRPLHWLHSVRSLVRAQFGFDRCAFGCVVFDVA